MTQGLDWLESRTCINCGKEIAVLYPDLWRYKRWVGKGHQKYLCSWKCLRAFDIKRKEERRMERTARIKKDGTPAKKPGRKPRTAAEAMQGMKEAADTFFGKCEEMGLRLEKPETPETPTVNLDGAITIQAKDVGAVTVETPEGEFSQKKPENMIGFKIVGIEGEFGRFFYDKKYNEIYWTTTEGEEISMDPTHWRIFCKQMPRVIEVLMAEGTK